MTRWKREFKAWAKREGLAVWAAPKDWHDWEVAKVSSRIFDHEYRRPEVQAEIERSLSELLIYGFTPVDAVYWPSPR